MAEFPASALTYVGNYAGPCYIHLNGEAIVVRYETGVVINKWPYNCIRQFRAEDETGKFSFVSGRRGPYGVAEYNFKLPNDSLNLLQSALTNFTGAQFSTVAPGSGSEGDQQQQQLQQQQLQQQQPHFLPRQSYSVSTAYQTTPKYLGGGRTESVSSSVSTSDNVFSSPAHSQQLPIPVPNSSSSSSSSSQGTSPHPPRLPPRDYSMTSLPGLPSGSVSDQSIPFNHSMDDSMMRSQMKNRSMTGSSTASSLSNTSMEAGSAHSMTPPSLPPRRPSHERAPEALVAQSTTYDEVNIQQVGKAKKLHKSATVDVLRPPPPVPPKKIFDRLREVTGSSLASGASEDTVSEEEQDRAAYVHSTSETESSLDAIHMTRSQMEQDRTSGTAKDKDSPYDHLPSEKEAIEKAAKAAAAESELAENRPSSISPEQNLPSVLNGKVSPFMEEEELELHRSSPTVKTRSITPENAKKIRKIAEEGLQHGRTLTASRVSSDGRIISKQNVHDQRKVQTVKARPSKARAQLGMNASNDTYQMPRPSSSNNGDAETRSHVVLNSPPNGRRGREVPYDATDVYNVPRPIPGGLENGDENVYKVPSGIQAASAGGGHAHNSHDVYHVPRAVKNDSDAGGIYNTPKKVEDEQGSNYDTPRNAQSTSPPRFSRSSSGKGNSSPVNDFGDISEELPPMVGRMRPTRSFESLHRRRVNTTAFDVQQRPPVGVYMDIELDRPIPPAKNAPLPPLPQLPVGSTPPSTAKPVSESVYWEISEETIEKNRNRLLRSTPEALTNRSPTMEKPRSMTVAHHSDHYSRPRLPEPVVGQGMTRAREQYGDGTHSGVDRSTVGGLHARHGSRPVEGGHGMAHSASAGSVLGNSLNKSRPYSVSDRNSFAEVDSSVLGTSDPLDENFLADEYVIVTGADRRPKVNPNPPMPAAVTAPTLADDEYEVMTSARADNIVQRQLQRVQYPTQFPAPYTAQYSTPDPSLYSHPPSNGPAPSAVPPPSQDIPKERSPPLQPRSLDMEENMAPGFSIDDMSPCDDQPVYHNVSHQRKSSSLSVCSSQSEGNEDADGDETSSTNLVAPSEGVAMDRNSGLVKTMEGSPLDATESMRLKNETRSLGNILEESHYQVPPTHAHNNKSSPASTSPPTSPLLQHHTPSTGTPTNATKKHHDYVNHMMNDGSRPSTPDLSPSLKQKRPQPLPRSLQRGESLTSETS